MRTREEAIQYGLTFDEAYADKPFPRADWQLIRVKTSKKTFLAVYERNGLNSAIQWFYLFLCVHRMGFCEQ